LKELNCGKKTHTIHANKTTISTAAATTPTTTAFMKTPHFLPTGNPIYTFLIFRCALYYFKNSTTKENITLCTVFCFYIQM
jgi:hypothetical protein